MTQHPTRFRDGGPWREVDFTAISFPSTSVRKHSAISLVRELGYHGADLEWVVDLAATERMLAYHAYESALEWGRPGGGGWGKALDRYRNELVALYKHHFPESDAEELVAGIEYEAASQARREPPFPPAGGRSR